MPSDGASDDVKASTPDIHPSDTPIHRATILQMTVDELDTMLIAMRERRMTQVNKLEALAKVRADDSILSIYIKLEKSIARSRKLLAAALTAEGKLEVELRKARLLAVECSTQ